MYSEIRKITLNTPYIILSKDTNSKEDEKKEKIKQLLRLNGPKSSSNGLKSSLHRSATQNDDSNSSFSSRYQRNHVRFEDSREMQRNTEPLSSIEENNSKYNINIKN